MSYLNKNRKIIRYNNPDNKIIPFYKPTTYSTVATQKILSIMYCIDTPQIIIHILMSPLLRGFINI